MSLYNATRPKLGRNIIMKYMLTLGLLLAGLSSATAQEQRSGWIADFDQAVEVAKAQNKDLLVDFGGSDW